MFLPRDILDSYDYRTDPVLARLLHVWDRLHIKATLSYAPFTKFGHQMMAHQNRVARDGANFLRWLGYSQKAAFNFRAAMLHHDIGKTHPSYDPAIWTLDDRPAPDQKALQKKHTRLGADMLEGFVSDRPDLKGHAHIRVRHAVTLCHHERVDGQGPERMNAAAFPDILKIACIVDAYDGDRIYRPHQERRRTPEEVLRRMIGEEDPSGKYFGAFDEPLLLKYVAFKQETLGLEI